MDEDDDEGTLNSERSSKMLNIRQQSKTSVHKKGVEIACQTSKVDFIDKKRESNMSMRKSPSRKLSHLRAATFRSPKRKASI